MTWPGSAKWMTDCFSMAKSYVFKLIGGRGLVRPKPDRIVVLYKSSNFVVVDKDPDIPVNTDSPEHYPVTVETQLRCMFPHHVDSSLGHGFRFCHRLDYSTSGVLCIALNKKAAVFASKAFQSRTAQKYYLALVHGHIEQDYLVINKGIGEDARPDFSHKMCSDDKIYCSQPRHAVTCLFVLQRGLYRNKPATKVLLKPITGRRHQLRVHCHEIGHTIVGDYTYSDGQDLLPHRMFLHAFRLVLPTPVESLDVASDDPFTEEKQDHWRPLSTVLPLDSNVYQEASQHLANFVMGIYRNEEQQAREVIRN